MSYAVVHTGGRQVLVSEGEVLKIDYRDDAEPGATIELGRVLLLKQEDQVHVGKPDVTGAKVTAEVLGHGKDKKIRIFKKKRRKGYRRMQGHRQDFTRVKVAAISI